MNSIDVSLFDSDIVYVSKANSRREVFKEVSDDLFKRGYVKESFLDNLNTREDAYPTGVDMTPVSTDYPNVAIPHTEANFVYKRKIVPVKLENPIQFHNMIDPSQKIEVEFLFMILNNDPEGQANVLAEIMDFLTQTPKEKLLEFFGSDSKTDIFNFLENNFTKVSN